MATNKKAPGKMKYNPQTTDKTKERSRTAKKKKLLKALAANMGVVTHACKKAHVSRETYYNFLRDDEEFAKEVSHIQESVIDEVEDSLFQQIKEGNTTAAIFFLKTRAQHRGYIEKNQLEMTGKIEHTGEVKHKQIISKLSDTELKQLYELQQKMLEDKNEVSAEWEKVDK